MNFAFIKRIIAIIYFLGVLHPFVEYLIKDIEIFS